MTASTARRRAGELLDAFGLTDAAGRLASTYSGGMRRRLDIAASLVVTPRLLFLDEPTTGLDPRSRNQFWELIRALTVGGTTVLLTTRYLDEADQLADRIAVIDHGSLIAEGTSGQLKASAGTGTLRVRLRDPGTPTCRAALPYRCQSRRSSQLTQQRGRSFAIFAIVQPGTRLEVRALSRPPGFADSK